MIIKVESDKERAINQIKALNVDKVWQVDIKQYKPNRSLAANRLYWKWLQIIGDDLGYHRDELHATLAVKFLGIKETICMGENISQPVSTSSLHVKEFSEYLNRIEMFSHGELGIMLPNSDDLYYEAMGIKRK